jgi:hypothetical protein
MGFAGQALYSAFDFSCLAVRDIAYLLETRAKRRIPQQKIYFGFILKTHLDTLGALFE